MFEFHHADLRQFFFLGDNVVDDHDHTREKRSLLLLLRHVRLVWVHATVFDDALMESVQQICEACPRGTYFAMVSKPLSASSIQTRGVLLLPMSWGQATVYIQKKLS